MQDLPQEFLTENSSVNVEFWENKKGEITAGTYLLSIAETVNGVQQIGTSALPAVKIYNLSSSGEEIVLKVDTLHSLKNFIRSAYYSAYPITL